MLWEYVEAVGALVGLCTGVFVIWDRFIRHYPTAFIVGAPLGGFGTRSAYLRVTNRSDQPILVYIPGRGTPDKFSIAIDHSIRGIATVVMGNESAVAIDGQQSIDLPLIEPSDFADWPSDRTASLQIKWQYAQPLTWSFWRPINIHMPKRNFDVLVSGTSSGSDEA